ncbi:alpha/beta fold hydrolase [Desulfoluna butyratoxydans]|uniref:Alpha/beta hydrolase fold n=1 Tax=Desulfoluna butyratoxydans TaxID=231438 RepID=A0A4U8YKZ9_9BACT|nr:alpha/beta hydrolase [Desulfoluna butyratoxydans]VFQ44270.1 alpha/beta hydrolase fold [Desulfoluna butyratoxydans]
MKDVLHAAGEFVTRHRGLAPETLETALMGDLEARSTTCEVNDHGIHWIEAGDGPPLVLVHGWSCSGYFWKPMIPLFKEKYRVLAPDLPGHGLSSKEHDSYLPEKQAERLLAWLSEIGVERFTLVGHSMGGEIAARMALQAPERVQTLTLAGAIGLKQVLDRLPWYARLALAPVTQKVINRFLTEKALARSHRLFMTGPGRPDYPECTRDIILTNTNTPLDLATLNQTTRDGLFRDFLDGRATGISLPTLCIWGEVDKLVPLSAGEEYARLIPDAHLAKIPATGHMIPWEEPERMASEIIGFDEQRR